MKKLFTIFATFAMLCFVGCSDIDTENPIVNMPSSGSVNNEGEDASKKVSIVGTWQAKSVIEGGTYTYQLTFNNDNSGVWVCTIPSWSETGTTYETHRSGFTYKFDMNHALLTMNNVNYSGYDELISEDVTAYITSHDGKDVLHFHSIYTSLPTVFTRIK